ncbi:choline dehydrogenase-like flavoprotein [Rhabdobacter roseus]|uniref:Choline dehydrogenase-like flavoprotein n=1 Tax=Rhabdobacter roseus TaxID=1655419 RepID=A0A840U0V5_9BACT|nr:GMC family oxidoreductase [Rhabdobacter roseus]MBB5287387.1 choline dehydrogenase-like flavoprotein [Rhabdobacter roseus]
MKKEMSDTLSTVHINSNAKEKNTFDAIVVGSGISGGWAAKELCEKGLKTLVLERGRPVEHVTDYPTALQDSWQLPHRGQVPLEVKENNPVASSCYAFNEATEHFFVKDQEHPYTQVKPFHWIRGYQVGGKSLIWGRWTQRWSDLDFEANAKEGIAVDWPIRYRDIAPWYSYVEKFAGISGNRDGIPHLPDGEFQPPMALNCLEKHFQKSIAQNYPDRQLITSRTANMTRELPGRSPCQYRDRCARGCPFGAYFSSNSATLPAAQATGNLTLRPHSVVHSIIYDEPKQKAVGVRVIDAQTKQETEYYASVLFLNAGTINTTALLLNSTSSRFPNGFGNDSGVLGHYLMDHNYRASFGGKHEGFQDQYYYGRKPTGVYIPRFRNVGKDVQSTFQRGYAYAAGGSRQVGRETTETMGAAFKEALTQPGDWSLWMTGMGECLPYADNKVTLSNTKKDAWGLPQIEIDFEFKENELTMLKEIIRDGADMLEKAGFKDIYAYDTNQPPGLGIHEMGTARMGRDPKTSILNAHNQVWGATNVFVTDGSCMTSNACQNPSLTYMALTARAADYAVRELKKKNL